MIIRKEDGTFVLSREAEKAYLNRGIQSYIWHSPEKQISSIWFEIFQQELEKAGYVIVRKSELINSEVQTQSEVLRKVQD